MWSAQIAPFGRREEVRSKVGLPPVTAAMCADSPMRLVTVSHGRPWIYRRAGQAFLVLTGGDLSRFWASAGEATYLSVRAAPLVIVPLSCKRRYLDRYAEEDLGWADESRWPMPFWHIDSAMAVLLILLTAVDEDLGAVFFGLMPDESAALRTTFGIPSDHEPLGAIAIGRGAEPARPAVASWRRPVSEMVALRTVVRRRGPCPRRSRSITDRHKPAALVAALPEASSAR